MKKLAPLLLILFSLICIHTGQAAEKPNILFIAIDDMNDWVGFLGGHPQAMTPNLDRLAEKGVNFTNAHCPAPGCSPSRNALLYGVEPFNSGLYPFYDKENFHDKMHKKYISLPRFLKENGYATYGAGKIHHGSKHHPLEWTGYHEDEEKVKKLFAKNKGYQVGDSSKMSFRPTIYPFKKHKDHKVADYGIDILKKKHDKPFFLAVGIVKPHLPFNCPEKFFDALPENITPPPVNEDDYDDIPQEGESFRRTSEDMLFKKDKAWEDVRRAYLACISWVDYNTGRVLDALEESPYADNTIIVVWSDHGYHLGDKLSFKKFTLWEEATRVPFIIYDSREKKAKQGRTCSQPVSLIDIYRTLAEMTDLKVPNYVEGSSLAPQLKDPSKPIEEPAITSWGRGNYAIRSENWRYIRYFDGTEELYSHKSDPNEWTNLSKSAKHNDIKKRLAKYLPKKDAPMVEGGAGWSIVGADRAETKTQPTAGKKKSKKAKK